MKHRTSVKIYITLVGKRFNKIDRERRRGMKYRCQRFVHIHEYIHRVMNEFTDSRAGYVPLWKVVRAILNLPEENQARTWQCDEKARHLSLFHRVCLCLFLSFTRRCTRAVHPAGSKEKPSSPRSSVLLKS